jgi:hypothetical protein
MKTVGICGVPATGKSTLMREVMSKLLVGTDHKWSKGKYGTLDYLECENLYVLGRYEGAQFDGTDKLSMSVFDHAEFFLSSRAEEEVVLFEGDRLFCERFIGKVVSAGEFLLINLYLSKDEQLARWKQRYHEGIQQTDTFIKGRITKYQNLRKKFPFIEMERNDTAEDREVIIGKIIDFVAPF